MGEGPTQQPVVEQGQRMPVQQHQPVVRQHPPDNAFAKADGQFRICKPPVQEIQRREPQGRWSPFPAAGPGAPRKT